MILQSPRRRAAAVVFGAAAVVYLASPVRQLSDSYYSLLVAEQLVTRGTLDLAEQFSGDLPLDRFPGARRDGLPYQVKRYGESVLYEFPLGAPLLAAPWMAAAHALGLGVIADDGRYDAARERRHQKLLAAAFAALFVAGAFCALDALLDCSVALDALRGRRAALAATAALALATPLWSTASRGFWSHTAELALLGLALPLLAARARGATAGGFRLGLLAGGAYLCRPTASIVATLVGVYLGATDRRALFRFALGALALFSAFVALSVATWGTPLPPYYTASRLELPALEPLAGVLVSPSRGLFVFEPALAAALLFAALRFRALEERRLFVLGAAGLALHALVVASFPHWWGGHGYGPRLFTETVFFQTLVVASVVATLRRTPSPGWRHALVGLVAAGAVIHGAGALSNQSNRWDWTPLEVDEHPERLWDWSDPQFLAWTERARRQEAAPALPEAASEAPGVDAASSERESTRKQRRDLARQKRRDRRGADRDD